MLNQLMYFAAACEVVAANNRVPCEAPTTEAPEQELPVPGPVGALECYIIMRRI